MKEIDFNKPIRLINNKKISIDNVRTSRGRFVDIGTETYYVNEFGFMFDMKSRDEQVENIPEPKRRFQAQYGENVNGAWSDIKYESDFREPTAWLIEEIDENGNRTYTYEPVQG